MKKSFKKISRNPVKCAVIESDIYVAKICRIWPKGDHALIWPTIHAKNGCVYACRNNCFCLYNSTPNDVLIPNSAGKPLALDVNVVHPLTPARLTSSASNPGQTLITAFNNKCRHTLEACSDEGIVFVPVCQESLGGYHERSASVLKRIALAQSRAKGTDETETMKKFFKKLSIILQKGNCSLFILRASF